MAKKTNPADLQPAGGRNAQDELLFGSDPKTHRVVRRKVKDALKKGQEPEPKYREGKSWRD